jgi:hypothetical protein
MSLPTILICFDTDPQPSVFDAVVAVDAGVNHLFRHGGIQPADVRDLVYGAMFTRAPGDLKKTAVFIGGQDVTAGEEILKQTTDCFFGPMRVSVMLDPNGANTTAAAAVLAARKHVTLDGAVATVLAATGPVGRRVVRLLAGENVHVRVASRQRQRAEEVCAEIRQAVPEASLQPCQTSNEAQTATAVDNAQVIVAAGAPAVELLADQLRQQCGRLEVAIDLSAVPPNGIGGIDPQDKAVRRNDHVCYGAIGVGGTKMKIHKAAIESLFESNALVLDADEIYAIGKQI